MSRVCRCRSSNIPLDRYSTTNYVVLYTILGAAQCSDCNFLGRLATEDMITLAKRGALWLHKYYNLII